MISILFTIVLGLNTYNVINNCVDMGGTYFPKDDSKENRVLSICVLDPDQTRQIVDHELVHICFHNDMHSFTSDKEMHQHLSAEQYTEEYIASVIGPCLAENQDKLFDALEAHNVHVSGSIKGNRPRADSRSNKCRHSKKTISCKR